MKRALSALLLLGLAFGLLDTNLRADEGMWTFDNPPLAQLRDKYGFTPSAEWLNPLQLASASTMGVQDRSSARTVS